MTQFNLKAAAADTTQEDAAATADSVGESLPLRAAVAAASREALLANRFADHAALHSLELALVDVHHRLNHARPVLSDSHAQLLQRIEAIL